MRKMTARYNGRCKDCDAPLHKGDVIRYSKATGALCANPEDCAFDAEGHAERVYFDRIDRAAEIRGFHDGEVDYEAATARRDEAEYQRGRAEVAQAQAFAPAGSALREQMYLEMEMAAYNRGEDY